MPKSRYTRKQVKRVWQRAWPAERGDPAKLRRDVTGHLIRFKEYGRRSLLGWVITRINPKGKDKLVNLRPLHWSMVGHED